MRRHAGIFCGNWSAEAARPGERWFVIIDNARYHHGTLHCAWREKAADGSIQERGPYHIVQRWANGRNSSQRVPAERLAEVREAINGYQKLKALTEEFAELTETLTERSGPLLPAKKNSSRQPAKRSSPKPKPSSKSRPGA